jgi:hypothetical protein
LGSGTSVSMILGFCSESVRRQLFIEVRSF